MDKFLALSLAQVLVTHATNFAQVHDGQAGSAGAMGGASDVEPAPSSSDTLLRHLETLVRVVLKGTANFTAVGVAIFIFMGAVAAFLKIRASWKRVEEGSGSGSAARAEPAEWVLFGNVYDLTPFMHAHPGGALVIQQLQGMDCTANFVSAHTLRVPTLRAIEKYRLRAAAPHEMDVSASYNWKHTPKHDAMRAEVRALFKGRSTKAPTWALIWYAAWVVTLLYSTWSWFVTGSLAAGMIMGIAMWCAALDIVHNGSHMNIFESPAANILASTLMGFWAWNTASWNRQHNLHHAVTNHEEDPDLHHFHLFGDYLAPYWGLAAGGWRLATSTKMKKAYTKWMFPFTFYTMITSSALCFLEPVMLLVTRHVMHSRTRFSFPTWEFVIAWLQVGTACTALLIALISHGLLAGLLPMIVSSMLFYTFTQISHANEASGVPSTGMAEEWAVAQVRASRGDYAYDSALWMLIAQGVNLQTVHHVFPSVHWAHYRSIWRILVRVAEDERHSRTFLDSIRDHVNFIGKINAAEQVPSRVRN